MTAPRILDATAPEHLDAVRALCWQYRDHLLGHNPATRAIVEGFYPEDGYRAVLAAFPGDHDAILLAIGADGTPLGCGMSHPLPDGSCEIKRIYVAPEGRGLGLGRALVTELVQRAAGRGQPRVLLDTLHSLEGARALYAALGFRERGPYDPGQHGIAELRFYERPLP